MSSPSARALAALVLLSSFDLPAASAARITADEARAKAIGEAEVGTNDFRISDMGPDGSATYDADSPGVLVGLVTSQRTVSVAYSATSDRYLVVWSADDDSLGDGEYEIWGQLIDGTTGAEIAPNDFRISQAGSDSGIGQAGYDAYTPDVAWNSVDNEFLVVWRGNDDVPSVSIASAANIEIWGQIVDINGNEIAPNDFQISSTDIASVQPSVAYNSTDNEYLVVFNANDSGAPGVVSEIWGQRIDAAGTPVGADDFRIGDSGNASSAWSADVAYNPDENEYFVVWWANTLSLGLGLAEFEIVGQLIDATGTQIDGTGAANSADVRVSDMGSSGEEVDRHAFAPAIVYNPDAGEYFVTWYGDDNDAGLDQGEDEIFGQRIDAATLAEVGTNDFRISTQGTDGDNDIDAVDPAVSYDALNRQYLVSWSGDDEGVGLADGEFEIWAQRLDGESGAAQGPQIRVSAMGPDGSGSFDAFTPASAWSSASGEYLVVWSADSNATYAPSVTPLVDNEFEIFGQRIETVTNLAVTKTVNAAVGVPGDTLTYTVTLTNVGAEAPVRDASFSDTPPTGTSLVVGSVTTDDGTITTGNTGGDSTVLADGFDIDPDETVTITFEVTVISPAAAGLTEVCNQGGLASSNADTVNSDDTAVDVAFPDPTCTAIDAEADLSATKTFSLFDDADSSGGPSPGDTILYTIVVTNNGDQNAAAVVFDDTPDSDTALVVGSVTTTQGAVVDGNTGGDTTVQVNVGTLVGGGASATITYRVTIDDGLPSGTPIVNQGEFESDGLGGLLTDDPATAPAADPTAFGLVIVQDILEIPTLGDFGLVALAGALAAAAGRALRKRNRR